MSGGDDARGAGPPRPSALLPDVLIARLEAAYVSVAADLPTLRRTVEDSGVLWQRVADPHLSVFTADRIVDRVLEAGRPPEDAVACLERASEIARGWSVHIHIERYTEIRLARRDDRRSLIALAAVRGLDPLFVRLSDVVGVALGAAARPRYAVHGAGWQGHRHLRRPRPGIAHHALLGRAGGDDHARAWRRGVGSRGAPRRAGTPAVASDVR